MRRSVSVAVLIAVAVLGVGAWSVGAKSPGPAGQQKADAPEVKIDNFSFTPPTLTVAVGATVTWVNRDDIPHTVVSTDDPKVFKSKALDTDDKFSFTFTKAGTHAYFCSLHPKMNGKVVVQ